MTQKFYSTIDFNIILISSLLCACTVFWDHKLAFIPCGIYILCPFLYWLLSKFTFISTTKHNVKVDPANRFLPARNATYFLRIFAALTVFYTHSRIIFGVSAVHSNTFLSILTYLCAWMGMGIFFCLSGYLICDSFIRRKYLLSIKSIKKFYTDRLIRIITLTYLVSSVILILAKNFSPSLIFRLYSFAYNGDNGPVGIRPQWSLTTEIQFYVLFPTLLLSYLKLKSRHPKIYSPSKTFVMVLTLGIVFRFTTLACYGFNIICWSKLIYVPIINNIDYFLTGALAAFIANYFRDITKKYFSWFAIPLAIFCFLGWETLTYLAMELGKTQLQSYFAIFGPTVICIGMLPLLVYLGTKDFSGSGIFVRSVRFAGELTFPFYLVHIVVLLEVSSLLNNYHELPFFLQESISFVITIGVASLVLKMDQVTSPLLRNRTYKLFNIASSKDSQV